MPLEEVPVDKIYVGEGNVRTRKAREGLDELKGSIKRKGLIQPIVVFRKDDKYELVVGQRRFLAVQELGWEKVPALVLGPMDTAEAKIYSASENIHRKDLSYADLVDACDYLYEKYRTVEAVAEELGISVSKAQDYLRHRLVPPKVRKMVDKGDITKTDAMRATLAGWPNEEKIMKIIEEFPTMTTNEKRRVVSVAQKEPEAPPEKIVEEAKKPPKEVELTFVLPTKYANALDKAATERGEEPPDTARVAVIDWLEAKGYA